MTYLLDTCVLSEFMKKSPDPRLLSFMASLNEKDTYLSAVSIGEIRKGIALLGRTKRAAFLRNLPSKQSIMPRRSLRGSRTLRSPQKQVVALSNRQRFVRKSSICWRSAASKTWTRSSK